MHLKRLYHPRKDGDPPRVRGVRIMRAKRFQNLSTTFLEGAEAEGWVSRSRGRVTVHGELSDGTKRDLVYQIAERPGLYSCHSGERIADIGDWKTAQAWVKENYAGIASPDPQNPSGYRANHAVSLVLCEGDEVEDMTAEEAKQMVEGVRETVAQKIRAKYGDRAVREKHSKKGA